MRKISRRAVVTGASLLFSRPAWADDAAFLALERQSGARLGVAALDTASGRRIAWRSSERFVMCSTFKLSLAAATLARADRKEESLDRLVQYDKSVPLGVSPATTRNLGRGMTVEDLCQAVMLYSDNGAANLLLAALGGPGAMTAFWRGIGDPVTRLDDNELKLNVPDGERNTTAPAAMLDNLNRLLLGEVLSPKARDLLLGWMRVNTTGLAMLRAGLPQNWITGDKTGRGAPGTGLVNDLAITVPPGRKPILIAVYTDRGSEQVVASAGKILAAAFA